MPVFGEDAPWLGKVYFISTFRNQYGWSNKFFIKNESRTTANSDLQSIVDDILMVCTPDVKVIAATLSDPTVRGDADVTVYNQAPGEGAWADATAGTVVVAEGQPVGSLDPDHALLIRLRSGDAGYRNATYLKGIPRVVFDEHNNYVPANVTGFQTKMTNLCDLIKSKCVMVNKSHDPAATEWLVQEAGTVVDQRIIRRAGGRQNYFTVRGRREAR